MAATHILSAVPQSQVSLRAWVPILIGLAILYLPVYVDLYEVFWRASRSAHGPVILLMVAWLFWRERHELARCEARGWDAIGMLLLGLGLIGYVLGRSHSVHQLAAGSQIPVLLGVVRLMLGSAAARRMWFPIALLLFVVPIPGSILDQLLLPLKEWVSGAVDATLHGLGYPIARNGVLLTIGPYSLLIADACAGLNSMVALTGIGLLYVYLAGHLRRWITVALLISVLPIAFLANIIRVAALVLITYYGGEASGRAFHDQASFVEIALAFGAFFALEHLIVWIDRARSA